MSETKKKKTLSEEARAARNAYKREWAKNHPDKVRAYSMRYWEKKARGTAAKEG